MKRGNPMDGATRQQLWQAGRYAIRKLTAAALLLTTISAFCGNASSSETAFPEAQLKAAFLFHFAEFVEWPDEAFRDQNTTMVYCTIGENDEMRGVLQNTLPGKTMGTRAVQLRRLRDWQAVQGCQVLFVGSNEAKRFASAVVPLKNTPILTVGESEDFGQEGGMIKFCQEENRVRFDINLGAVKAARLKMSARLLALAKSVTGREN